MPTKLTETLFSFYLFVFLSSFLLLLLYSCMCVCVTVLCVCVYAYLHVSGHMWVGSTSVCICMHVHMGAHACMCIYAHVCTCMWIHMCVHITCWCQISSPLIFTLLKSLSLKLVDAASFTNHLAPGAPCPHLLRTGIADGPPLPPNFPVGSCDPNSSPLVCLQASALFAGPSLGPLGPLLP